MQMDFISVNFRDEYAKKFWLVLQYLSPALSRFWAEVFSEFKFAGDGSIRQKQD
jgi:hypothetical protein